MSKDGGGGGEGGGEGDRGGACGIDYAESELDSDDDGGGDRGGGGGGSIDKDLDEEDALLTRLGRPAFVTSGPLAPVPTVPPELVTTITDDAANQALDLHTGGTWSVSIHGVEASIIAGHLKELTCTPRAHASLPPHLRPKSFPLGYVHRQRLYMPAWYAYLAFPGATPTASTYTRGDAMHDDVVFTGKVFTAPPQRQTADAYVAHVRANPTCTSCILSLPCGMGKTVTALYIASKLRRVTLVLVHKLPLLDQWVAEARAFLGPAVRVGRVNATEANFADADVVVASVQSLASHLEAGKAYVPDLLRRVGVVIMDEGHHAVASTFARVLSAVPALYRIVLTATPRRKDGLMHQLQRIAGPVVFRAFRNVGEVNVVAVQYETPPGTHAPLFRGKFLQSAEMLNRLCSDATRTQLALALLTAVLVPQGRRVLVVTPRVTHVHAIADAVDAEHAAGRLPVVARTVQVWVPQPKPKPPRRRTIRKTAANVDDEDALRAARAALRAEEDKARAEADAEWERTGPHGAFQPMVAPVTGRVLAGMGVEERNFAYEAHVVVTTTCMMEEGISYKQWDTLLNLDVSRDPEQVVGRILRACDTKRVPLVIDVWHATWAGSLWRGRLRHYREEGFLVQHTKCGTAADVPGPEFWAPFDKPTAKLM